MSINYNAFSSSSSTSASPTGFAVSPPSPFGIYPNPNSPFSSTSAQPTVFAFPPPPPFEANNGMVPAMSLPWSMTGASSSLFGAFGSPSPFGGSAILGPPTGAAFGSAAAANASSGSVFGASSPSNVSASSPTTLFRSSSSPTNTAPSLFGTANPEAPQLKPLTVKKEGGSPEEEKGSIGGGRSVVEDSDGGLSPTSSHQTDPVAALVVVEFDGLAMSANKAAVLENIKRIHQSCLSMLHLCSKAHRRAAYEHLVQVILDLKAIGGNGDTDSYDEIERSLNDLEVYGFDMGWLREEVVKLQKSGERRMQVLAEKAAKRRAREKLLKQLRVELLKQLEAIDAELAKEDDPASPGSVEFLSALLSSP